MSKITMGELWDSLDIVRPGSSASGFPPRPRSVNSQFAGSKHLSLTISLALLGVPYKRTCNADTVLLLSFFSCSVW